MSRNRRSIVGARLDRMECCWVLIVPSHRQVPSAEFRFRHRGSFFWAGRAISNTEQMIQWHKPVQTKSPSAAIVTQSFVYDATTLPYPTDTIPYQLLAESDQLVIRGDLPGPNTVIYMPPHTALLGLFPSPQVDDQFAIDVTNLGTKSVDLTISKNSEPTGSPNAVYHQPTRITTIPASRVVRLYFRIMNATPQTGVADVAIASDGSCRENVVALTGVLARLERLPIYEFNYIGQPLDLRYRGPMEQEWNAQFEPSEFPGPAMRSKDMDVVALASVKELLVIVQRQADDMAVMSARIDQLERAGAPVQPGVRRPVA